MRKNYEICPTVSLPLPHYDVEINAIQSIENPFTQLKAFKSIVHLITRFPGLRPLFLRSQPLQADEPSKESAIQLWGDGRDTSNYPSEWNFFLEFAASCLSDEAKVGDILEGSNADDLGHIPVDTGEYSVIERLLVASDCR